jgi:hypothetical protein
VENLCDFCKLTCALALELGLEVDQYFEGGTFKGGSR